MLLQGDRASLSELCQRRWRPVLHGSCPAWEGCWALAGLPGVQKPCKTEIIIPAEVHQWQIVVPCFSSWPSKRAGSLFLVISFSRFWKHSLQAFLVCLDTGKLVWVSERCVEMRNAPASVREQSFCFHNLAATPRVGEVCSDSLGCLFEDFCDLTEGF